MSIFFDLDGTLVDTSKRHYAVYSECIQELGGSVISQAQYWELKRKKAKWPEIFGLSGVDARFEPEFLKAFITKIESPPYLDMDTLFDGARDVVEQYAKDYECYLVSLRRNHNQLTAQLKRLGIDHHFSGILSGHSETDGYDKKIELIKPRLQATEPNVIIGDTEADVITGHQLGIATIAVTSGIRDASFLEALKPDFLIEGIASAPQVLQDLFKD